MSIFLRFCPQPPDFAVEWGQLNEAIPWIRNLAGCTQDSINHGEGDVWMHLRMVCEELAALDAWRDLPAAEQETVFAAVLLHDVAKPECRREELNGHISFRHHSGRGSILARQILWRMNMPMRQREQVASLVRFHQIPFWFIDRADAERLALEISLSCRCDHLAILAEADARGRICRDPQKLLDNIALFAESCRELGCLNSPFPFPSDHTRFLYFRKAGWSPYVPAHEDFRTEVTLMSGLPGAGKSHWIQDNAATLPLVSLDALRTELNIDPADNQGRVVSEAREHARILLRQGKSFVWNATSLSRQLRRNFINLAADYQARVRIVYVETDETTLHEQNRSRDKVVPRDVIEKCLDRWEVPDLTEAHQVEWVVN